MTDHRQKSKAAALESGPWAKRVLKNIFFKVYFIETLVRASG